jgi:hypothetical protein
MFASSGKNARSSFEYQIALAMFPSEVEPQQDEVSPQHDPTDWAMRPYASRTVSR